MDIIYEGKGILIKIDEAIREAQLYDRKIISIMLDRYEFDLFVKESKIPLSDVKYDGTDYQGVMIKRK